MDMDQQDVKTMFQRDKRYLYIFGFLIIFTRILDIEVNHINLFDTIDLNVEHPERIDFILGGFFVWFMIRFNVLGRKIWGDLSMSSLDQKCLDYIKEGSSPLSLWSKKTNKVISQKLSELGYPDLKMYKFGIVSMSGGYPRRVKEELADKTVVYDELANTEFNLSDVAKEYLDSFSRMKIPIHVKIRTCLYALRKMLISDLSVSEIVAPILFIAVVTGFMTYYTFKPLFA